MLFIKINKKVNHLKKIIAVFAILLLIISIFPRCAKIVAPNGGPKDTLAPVLVRSQPKLNATKFKENKIIFNFNEFIQLKEIQKKLAISPPMAKRPEFLQRGKNLEIRFKEPLKDSTTYTIYFADAIVDNNEGNAIKNFVFAFSTGETIDSLVVTGKIIDAFTLLPVENAFVLLYEKQNDSVPIKELPRYLTRTNRRGIFTINNIRKNSYKVFALVDNNSNYKFDQISEDIAFTKDTLKGESLIDPSKVDTSKNAKLTLDLRMFKENPRLQAFSGFSRAKRNKLSLAFTKKPEGKVVLNPLNFKADSSWYILEKNQQQDSSIYWITDNNVNKIDTLLFELSYLRSDSLEHLNPKTDTLKMIFVDQEAPKKRKKEKEEKSLKKSSLVVLSSIINAQNVKPNINGVFTFPIPLKKIEKDSITFMNLKDSSIIKGIELLKDTINPRIYRYHYNWQPDIQYSLQMLPGAFTALNGLKNDSININFKGANPDNYGILNVNLLNSTTNVIVQLCNEKKTEVIDYRISKNGEKVTFSFIDPGKYSIRLIEDKNANGVWDTGWYLKGIQPEKVYHYTEGKTKGVLNIRANWENDITFDFSK